MQRKHPIIIFVLYYFSNFTVLGKEPTASGTPYTVEIVFTGLQEGNTTARIEARSPTGIRYDEIYEIMVDADLKVTATLKEHIEGGQQ